jgi:hypothetical protein
MLRRFKKSVVLGAFAMVALAAATVLAQSVGDFPMWQGSPARQGKNLDAIDAGSGRTVTRWVAGLTGVSRRAIIQDNPRTPRNSTDQISWNGRTDNWFGPAIEDEASGAYIGEPNPNAVVGVRPTYLYARAFPSSTNLNNPDERKDGQLAETFTWWFNPQNPGLYSVSVWIPQGSTRISGRRVFPQRYYVYRVYVNNVVQWVDVVDTYAAGNGWVRLGNGGRSTNAVVFAAATDTIRVQLFQTMPRNADGSLSMPVPEELRRTVPPPTEEQVANAYLVYADAAKISQGEGTYLASPVAGTFTSRGGTDLRRVVAARNDYVISNRNGERVTTIRGAVRSFWHNGLPTRDPVWTYVPLDGAGGQSTTDDAAATVSGSDFTLSTANGNFVGTGYRTAVLGGPPATSFVRYQPSLATGDYEIWAYCGGDGGGQQFGRNVVVEVREGTTLTRTSIDQSAEGWVRIGARRFRHESREFGRRLDVRILNESSDIAGDVGRRAFADAIRFVGSTDQGISSTPLQVTARVRQNDGVVRETPVVIVADERGILHCLDAEGNPDGTTTVYWTYPSTPEAGNVNWRDPNVAEGRDGNASDPNLILAEMPNGFDIGSALVTRIAGEDYLYIASENGRVYCIQMSGRGDYNRSQSGTALRHPGTTRRMWSYPNDPFDDPATGLARSPLGAFRGSVSFATTAAGPTVYVPTLQGRLIALNAVGNTNRTTSVRWQFPATGQPALGPIVSTPSVDFGSVFFGSAGRDEQAGRFYAVNAETGTAVWQTPDSLNGFGLGDFRASPTTAARTQLGDTSDFVFALNENGRLYAFDAADGSVIWATGANEQRILSGSALGFTSLSINTRTGLKFNTPVVVVPGQDGRLRAFYARRSETTPLGRRFAWGRVNQNGEPFTAAAFSNSWLFTADQRGLLYALADPTTSGASLAPGEDPLDDSFTEEGDDAQLASFQKAKVKIITREAYRRLSQAPGGELLSYNDAVNNAAFTSPRRGFDWGESIYVLVYDFPYTAPAIGGQPAGSIPPTITVDLSTDGRVVRQQLARTMQFQIGTNPRYNDVDPTALVLPENPSLDGYAILEYQLQSAGANVLPPGEAQMSVNLRTPPSNSPSTIAEISVTSLPFVFSILNPLGVQVVYPDGTVESMAVAANPTGDDFAAAQANGSPDLATRRYTRMTSSPGFVPHGQSGQAIVRVFDRSLMTLLRPGGAGIDNIRVRVADLAWQGGANAVFKPLDGARYPRFEDRPAEEGAPNQSFDYPDIGWDRIAVTKEQDEQSQNPLIQPSTLFSPTDSSGGALTEDEDPTTRRLRPTEFRFSVNVPQFQPPNFRERITNPALNMAGAAFAGQGYIGRVFVFVDSTENGQLDLSNQREAYRSVRIAASVPVDQRVEVAVRNDRSILDLGSLAQGTGYSPLWPGDAANGAFDPFIGAWADAYQELEVRNVGNVNLWNVRLAKRAYPGLYGLGGNQANLLPFRVGTSANADDLSYLDGTLDLWSNVDRRFAPPFGVNDNPVMLQKPRVGDPAGRPLNVNPAPTPNPLLGATGSDSERLFDITRFRPGPMRVSVSVPFGFPVGQYVTDLAVVEDLNYGSGDPTFDGTESLSLHGSGSTAFEDTYDTFKMTFRVRETRITTASTPRTATVFENIAQPTTGQAFPFANAQPAGVRDPFGAMLFAWVSDRPQRQVVTAPTAPAGNDRWRIYFGALGNTTSYGSAAFSTPLGGSPLRDLSFFAPSTSSQWLNSPGPSAGYPNRPATELFGAGASESSMRFGAPTFATNGFLNPVATMTATDRLRSSTFMAFVGEANRTGPNGMQVDSRIFATRIQQSAGGSFTIPEVPVALTSDTTTRKGKPAVAVTPGGDGDGALVLYSGSNSGRTGLFYSRFNGSGFSTVRALDVGPGFENPTDPSLTVRPYSGRRTDIAGRALLEASFSARLKGERNTEVFTGRMVVGPDGLPVLSQGTPWVLQPLQVLEPLARISRTNFRARGVQWNLAGGGEIRLLVQTPTAVRSVLLDGFNEQGTGAYNRAIDTRQYDDQGRIVTFDSRLGGKVYLDSSTGSVRLVGGSVPANAQLFLTYQPLFLRTSGKMVGNLTGSTMLFDRRFASGTAYWFTASGQVLSDSAAVPSDRLLLFFGRSSSGAASAARPMMQSLRFGIQLPLPIAVNDSGGVNVVVSGNVGPYQVDPAAGRVYFTAADEDSQVTVNYTGVDQGGTILAQQGSGIVALTPEVEAQPVQIEQATNETSFAAFLDPFTYADPAFRRPPLVWSVWSSTRGGNSDIFFQAIAPRLGLLQRNP